MARYNRATCSRSSDMRRASVGRFGVAGLLAVVAAAQLARAEQEDSSVLRVCADPSNMPLSNQNGEGYENQIAQELARDLGRKVEYTFFPQRMGFVRNTLRQKDAQTQQYKCDVI